MEYVEVIFPDTKRLRKFYSVDFTGQHFLKMLLNIANLVFHVKSWGDYKTKHDATYSYL